MPAPGMMYLGRAGPSKMIEFACSSFSLADAEGEGETNTAGRIGPSKMSTHSLTFSLLDDFAEEFLIRGVGGDGGRTAVDAVRGITWACLEIEDE